MKVNLLPKSCPFCGECEYEESCLSLLEEENGMFRIHCHCGAEGPWADNEIEAICEWNHRRDIKY